jgi:hypothetical protein
MQPLSKGVLLAVMSSSDTTQGKPLRIHNRVQAETLQMLRSGPIHILDIAKCTGFPSKGVFFSGNDPGWL